MIVFADIHIHNYQRFDKDGSRLLNCLKALDTILSYAEDELIVFCGDFFDKQKYVPTVVLNETIRVLDKHRDKTIIGISGNHDQAQKNLASHVAETSLTVLDELYDNFILIDDDSIDTQVGRIHGVPYYEFEEDFLEAVSRLDLGPGKNYLLAHQTPQQISNKHIPTELDITKLEGFDYVFMGHIHKHEQLSPNCVMVGSPLWRDFGDSDDPKGFLHFNEETQDYKFIEIDLPKYEEEYLPTIKEEFVSKQSVLTAGDSTEDMVRAYAKNQCLDNYTLSIGLKLMQ